MLAAAVGQAQEAATTNPIDGALAASQQSGLPVLAVAGSKT
jgi:hypothetical protein